MSAFPLFYQPELPGPGQELELEEDTARHIVQVLRMQPGDRLALTDGQGRSATVAISLAAKKKCRVLVQEVTMHPAPAPSLTLGIAFTRHSGRNEWLLEKATELGVRRIVPLQTTRSERERFRPDRWQNILVAAMIQSQQYHLPVLEAPLTLSALLADDVAPQRLIAHCIHEEQRSPVPRVLLPGRDTLLCIGPEGDFTPEELTLAAGQGCAGISLGSTRLRTETAAIAACAYFHLINDQS